MPVDKSPRSGLSCQVEHVSLKFIQEVNQNLCTVQVASNTMFIALKTGHVFIIYLDDPATVYSFLLPMLVNNQEKLLHIWVNPEGDLVLFKTNFAKYYLGHVNAIVSKSKDSKVTTLKKMNKKNCDIQTVDWSFDKSAFLIGTKEGKAYYVNAAACVRNANDDAQVTRVYSSSQPIDGIAFRKNNGALLVTGSQIFFWNKDMVGASDPIQTFSSVAPTESEQYEQSDKEFGLKFTTMNNKFAWVTQSGIVFGDMSQKNALSNAKVLLYLELPASTHRVKDVRLTDFHLVILRGSEIIIVNQLTMKIVFQESIFNTNEIEKLHSLSVDYTQEPPTIWCYSGSNVYEIVMSGESKSVWKLLCENNQFEDALSLKHLSPLDIDTIHSKYGDYYYDNRQWLNAANEYSKTKMINNCGPIALKFMDSSDKLESLQLFLNKNLQKTHENSQVKQTILSSWIVWNYVNQLNDIDEIITKNPSENNYLNRKQELEQEFKSFIKDNLPKLDRETVYLIISRQNRKKELLFFATLVQDYEYVLSYWIKLENWYESLKLIASLQDPNLIYKYSNILLVSSPDATINTWMQIPNLDPLPLIPSILSYYTSYQNKKISNNLSHFQNHGTVYLKWCIREQRNVDPLIHNTFLYMMITDNVSEKDQEIIQFLKNHSKQCYDKDFILRLSLRFKKHEISIFIYSELSLYEEAVNLALERDMLKEAKNVVSLVSDKDLKKQLWLKIASLMIGRDRDIKNSVTTILQECGSVLSIKDLLPLFDEFVTIANLKEELVRNLEKHSMQITKISRDIKDSLKIKQEIKQDIKLFEKRYEKLA